MKKPLDALKVMSEFPLLQKKYRGAPLHYLDSAASSLKPQIVIDRLSHFYANETANVHRGSHLIGDLATEAYEKARKSIAQHLKAGSESEIIFTRGTTEAINLVAQSFGELSAGPGDKFLISEMEHHSNIVPWQVMTQKCGASLEFIKVTPAGELDLEDLKSRLDESVKLISVVHCSNAIGTVNPIKEIVSLARKVGAKVFVDGAQSINFMEIDLQDMGCDFFAFSGHKLFGPFGIGVLWGREELLNKMPPYQTGGSMISEVQKEKTTFLSVPHRFEAGTPNVAGAVGLATALDWLYEFDLESVQKNDRDLTEKATELLKSIPEIKIIGDNDSRATIVSFVLEGTHPADVGQLLDQQNIAVRAGHHCCQPLMKRFNLPGTVRASFSIYNTQADVDALYKGVIKAKELLL